MPEDSQQIGPSQAPPLVFMAIGAVAVAAVGFWLLLHGNMALLLALVLTGCLFGVYIVNRNAAIYVTLIYLLLLGDIRRISGWLYGFPNNDPLIVVGALFAFIIATPILFRSRFSDTTSKLCLGLVVVMFIQVFNPAQGGLSVGVTGMLFSMTPLMWFWIGRTFGTETVLRVVLQRVLVPVAVLASIYGRYQNLVGLNPWQQAWIDHIGKAYVALHLGHSIRPFGFSPSASEYINMLGMATVVALAGFVAGRRFMILPLAILLPSLVLAGSRGAVVRALFTGALAFAFTGRKKSGSTFRFVLAVVLVVGGLGLVLSGYGGSAPNAPPPDIDQETAADVAISRQVEGLKDPLHSTAVGHSAEILGAARVALSHPAGFGLGSTSIAAKLAEGQTETAGSSEFDLTDSFLALGLPGGLLYLGFIWFMYRDSIRYIKFGPKDLSLPVLGILAAFLGDWLFPGEYANGPLLWLAAGCVVRAVIKQEESVKTAVDAEFLSQGEALHAIVVGV